MSLDKAIKKFGTLGVFQDTPEYPNAVEQSVRIYENSDNLDDIGVQLAERLPGCGSGSEQFLYSCLSALLEKDPEFRAEFKEKANQELGDLGIKPEHIEHYLQSTGSASVIFAFEFGDEYSAEVRKDFYKKANQFALDGMKGWLEIKPTTK